MFKNTHNQLIHNFASYLDKDLLLRPIQDESTIDAEMKCEGRGSIVTSPVDVMDDIHGSTSTTANKQSCSSSPSLEEGKGSKDIEVTWVDQAQSAPSSLEDGGDNIGKCVCIFIIFKYILI